MLDEHSVQGSLLMTPVDDLDVVIDDLRRQVADLHADRDQLLAGVARLEARIAELERERPDLIAAVGLLRDFGRVTQWDQRRDALLERLGVE